MNIRIRKDFILTLVFAAACGALSGAAAGFYASADINPVGNYQQAATTTQTQPVGSTTTFALVPLERRAVAPLVPPVFLTRRASSVAEIFRKGKATGIEERMLGDEKLMGQAVALTSDGWFVTHAAVIDGLKLADLVLFHAGTSYAVERAYSDSVNGAVYLKTSAQGLVPTAFAHVGELARGAEAWVEARPDELTPSVVLQDGMRTTQNDSVSSELASRRIALDGMTRVGDMGGAVWDPKGSLLGIIDSKTGERLRIIPATTLAASLSSLLSNNEIKHAYLGVRAMDLSYLRLEGTRGALPAMGAWLTDDKKTGKPAVAKDSPAAKAGLKAGDVILRVERDILDGTADLGEVLADYRPGTEVTLRVLRDSKDTDVRVTLGSVVTSEVLK